MGKKILLVDDTETVLMFEKMMLAGNGYEFLLARDGAHALEQVEKCRPDIILLDIMMPEIDGIEVCQRLKDNPKTRDIPIIMVTTKGQPELVEKAFLAECNDYLTKPLDKLELLTKIKNFLE